jgi:hypothetical protein
MLQVTQQETKFVSSYKENIPASLFLSNEQGYLLRLRSYS